MTIIKISEARGRFGRLVDEAAASPEPVLITGKRGNVGATPAPIPNPVVKVGHAGDTGGTGR